MTEIVRAPRKIWLATVLSLFSPGLGLLCSGRPLAAFSFAIAPRAALVVAMAISIWVTGALVYTLLAGVSAAGLIWLGQVIYSGLSARRVGDGYVLRPYNHVAVYVVFGLTIEFGVGSVAQLMRDHMAEPFHAPAASMEPTLHTCALEQSAPGKRHGVLAFAEYAQYRRDFGPQQLGPDEVFILGDNRDNANDSRFHGPVPVSNIAGRVVGIYFGRTPTGEADWTRLGVDPTWSTL